MVAEQPPGPLSVPRAEVVHGVELAGSVGFLVLVDLGEGQHGLGDGLPVGLVVRAGRELLFGEAGEQFGVGRLVGVAAAGVGLRELLATVGVLALEQAVRPGQRGGGHRAHSCDAVEVEGAALGVGEEGGVQTDFVFGSGGPVGRVLCVLEAGVRLDDVGQLEEGPVVPDLLLVAADSFDVGLDQDPNVGLRQNEHACQSVNAHQGDGAARPGGVGKQPGDSLAGEVAGPLDAVIPLVGPSVALGELCVGLQVVAGAQGTGRFGEGGRPAGRRLADLLGGDASWAGEVAAIPVDFLRDLAADEHRLASGPAQMFRVPGETLGVHFGEHPLVARPQQHWPGHPLAAYGDDGVGHVGVHVRGVGVEERGACDVLQALDTCVALSRPTAFGGHAVTDDREVVPHLERLGQAHPFHVCPPLPSTPEARRPGFRPAPLHAVRTG
ncbi:hypothetical protein [Streptomyces sp. GbtcB6]|uniref:hypothetical protein n=1 Tax=Streptomyces sp. GbtcB6 TaxID=2824751 RepID=UPI001C2FD305|nr:hypothetical protein [Streptomyces sp. GbtcB6]